MAQPLHDIMSVLNALLRNIELLMFVCPVYAPIYQQYPLREEEMLYGGGSIENLYAYCYRYFIHAKNTSEVVKWHTPFPHI